ncbi:hypothetical protein BOW53_06255 [Solemya pervernicosa gill symbiont]|uniref:FimV N-terminal domain-containing protein n=2 Tax=Gammaproteobacteria incertae sedis TaxID=118884 RepID=A0A1T2L6T7_9GAMM|nr:FimV/HubP family polar landmark protein [Candidatus Reidiella endopervernicosa]OOZ40817.1 hypothetical protein BOW53_06255 [Solemya pervernicosa gill symbiont]QKQ26328.1 FimV family protein [Candidatus Reidiella endopervernicosa]
MLRKLVTVMIVMALTSIQGVYALGLGEIDLRSALNQKLDATIKLHSSRMDELKGAEVRLASQAAFDRAGIERLPILLKLKFAVAGVDRGEPVVAVSSDGTIDEPFLNFLVEVNWANGRLLREYTLLLDPPSLMPEPAPVIDTPKIEQVAIEEEIVATPIEAPVKAAPAPAPVRKAAPKAPSRITEHGPTKKGETLWEIASKVRPDNSISVNQMMQALLRHNPEAFFNNNINNLKTGYVLRVPDRQTILAFDNAAARAATREQTRKWREDKSVTTASPEAIEADAVPAEAADGDSGGRLKIVAPAPKESVSEAATGADGVESASSNDAELQRELNLLAETTEAQRQQNEELQERMSELEKQLETAKRLLELKDDELAAMQGRAAEEPVEAVVAVEVESTVAIEPAETTVAEKAPAVTPVAEAPKPVEPVAVAEPEIEVGSEEELELVDEILEQISDYTDDTIEFVEDAMEDPTVLAGAGGAIAIIALIIWLLARRRRMGMTEFQESILAASPKPSGFGETSEAAAEEQLDTPSLEQTNLSEFGSVSGMGDIQSEVSEVDPIAEADVYIAYGRYQQAEDMLSEAVSNEPDRNDLKLKLLEVYHATKNQRAFEENAESLYASLGGQSDPMWDRVVAMSNELGIDNPIFGGSGISTDELSAELDTISGGADMTAADDAAVVSSEISDADISSTLGADEEFSLDIDLDSGEFGSETVESADSATAEIDLGEFNLDETVESDVTPEVVEESDLNFSLDESATSDPVVPSVDPVASADEEPVFDLGDVGELQLDLPEEATADAADEAVSDSMGEFDLSSFDLPEEGGADEIPLNAGESTDISLDEVPEFDLGELETETAESADEDNHLMGSLDEVGTKLDLAKAYIDMGDPDGARSILNEVLEEGDDTQKGEAEGLLSQL